MSNEYNYDADAEFYPYFILIVSSLVTLPLTLTLLRAPGESSFQTNKAGHITSTFRPDDAELIDAQRTKQKRKELRLKRMLMAASGWLLMAYMIFLIYTTDRASSQLWDPYTILDVPIGSTEKQVNSRYRRLSTTMHPDKRKPNAALNQTLETINDEWVEIVKAYKSLTDDDIRKNWEQYGNPDGKQSTSFGIALPQFLVADGNGKYVLAFYGMLLGIFLPFFVGSWWYGMRSKTKERILVTSAGNMFREYHDRMDTGDISAAASTAVEFNDILHGHKADADLGKLESKLFSSEESATFMLAKDKKKLKDLEDPVRRKTLALAWAYLARLDLDDKTLEAEKYEVAPTALQMNEAFLPTCLAHGFIKPVLSSYELSQSLVQAVPPSPAGRAPLLQLPHFTSKVLREIQSTASVGKNHMSIQSFMALPAEQRQTLAQAAGLTNERLKAAEDVARQLPLLRVEKAWFKVQGEKYIIPSSLVQYVVKARFIPPGTPAASIPPLTDEDLLDLDPAEGDLKAQKIEPEQHHIPLAHAPFFARDRAPKWHLFLADTRQAKIAVPPFTFSTFDKKPFDSDGKPTFNIVTLKMQFAAPPQAGEFKFQMNLVCDSYVGFDHKQEAVLLVEDASKVQAVDSDDDISEPEEDSIAGQMAALKGQSTTDANKSRKSRKTLEESDYESGTDEDEEEESETDTDTDSEAEDAPPKKGWW